MSKAGLNHTVYVDSLLVSNRRIYSSVLVFAVRSAHSAVDVEPTNYNVLQRVTARRSQPATIGPIRELCSDHPTVRGAFYSVLLALDLVLGNEVLDVDGQSLALPCLCYFRTIKCRNTKNKRSK